MEVAQAKQKEKNFNYINSSDQKEDRPSFARKKGVVSAAFDFLQKKPRWDGVNVRLIAIGYTLDLANGTTLLLWTSLFIFPLAMADL
ncbi:hypothetical protein T4D_9931 [Trichinella pseudospiralis]|uniref:Uncharacterized protein n=1 Tax=Trichinella pseudospiralis TaxID=6337 RepID=A0A0V1F5S1_TRIPS|nr:hypothetical protein T4D_9931 [Trichinella pseudospiralis]